MKTNKILKGRIISFNPIRGFGFVASEYGDELFFHSKSIIGKTIEVGDLATFIAIPAKKHIGKYEAVNVTKAYLSKDNYYVVDRPYSHMHDNIVNLLPTIINSIECNGVAFFEKQLDYDRPIGNTTCVKVNGKDEILYAIRFGRNGYTKFVKNRLPEPTSSITIVLKKTIDFYIIITAFLGKKSEVEPWDERATEASFGFWQEHALIHGTEKIDFDSITFDCPWNKELLTKNPTQL